MSLAKWSTFKVFHSRVGTWPYPQTLNKAEKDSSGTNTLAYPNHSEVTKKKAS
jgi:hypothetical protein